MNPQENSAVGQSFTCLGNRIRKNIWKFIWWCQKVVVVLQCLTYSIERMRVRRHTAAGIFYARTARTT